MDIEILYFTLSIITAALSIAAIYAAWNAMQKGLTQTAVAATMWALSFIAVGRVLHTLRELFQLPEISEMLEYSLYIIAYIVFIELILRARTIQAPKEFRNKYIIKK